VKKVHHTGWSKSSLCTWWLQHRKLQIMFKVSPASLLSLIDTRLTLTPSIIPNSKRYHGKWLKLFKSFLRVLYCKHQVHRGLLITLYKVKYNSKLQTISKQGRRYGEHVVRPGKNIRWLAKDSGCVTQHGTRLYNWIQKTLDLTTGVPKLHLPLLSIPALPLDLMTLINTRLRAQTSAKLNCGDVRST
jgi:hypothetical protein